MLNLAQFLAAQDRLEKIETDVEGANARADEAGMQVENHIPKGPYCYTPISLVEDPATGMPRMLTKRCPFWAIDPSQPMQMNGYCAYMGAGDWEDEGTLLLWDQVKECGVHEDDDNEDAL